jgi:formylglycine-generating enzyme required for sulfatase activity
MPQGPNRAKHVVIGVVGLAITVVIVAALWHLSPSKIAQKVQQTPQTQPSEPQQEAAMAKAPEKSGEPVIQKPWVMAAAMRVSPKDGLKYIWIPPGTFMMGCSPGDGDCGDDEKPPHQVTITKGFWLGQTEVTVGAYKRFAAGTGRPMPPEPNFYGRALNREWGDEAMPIVDVTWGDAQAYCSWAGGRLPTEAEWEYAARAGNTTSRYGDLDEIAWYANNSGRQRLDSTRIRNEDQANYLKRLNGNGNGLHEVAQKRANGFGLYDMLGNVLEWVNDWFEWKYDNNNSSLDPAGPARSDTHVMRGGSWEDSPSDVRVSHRSGYGLTVSGNYIGFRCGGEVVGP